MTHSNFKKIDFYRIPHIKKNVVVIIVFFTCIVCITIFQDFLDSNRSGYSFYLSESILFKTIWILFLPLLILLNRVLKNQNIESFNKAIVFIIIPIIMHLIILPIVFLFFSVLFYNGRYDIYKILTYTLANDLYKLVLVYSAFVFGYRYLTYKSNQAIGTSKEFYQKNIIITNGKKNVVVKVDEIYKIIAATPYIEIQLKDKKHLHTETLKSIYTQLNNEDFVRVHKSTIVNMDKVVSYKSRLTGDYDIFLKDDTKIRLSRTYASNFKSKYRQVHQVTT